MRIHSDNKLIIGQGKIYLQFIHTSWTVIRTTLYTLILWIIVKNCHNSLYFFIKSWLFNFRVQKTCSTKSRFKQSTSTFSENKCHFLTSLTSPSLIHLTMKTLTKKQIQPVHVYYTIFMPSLQFLYFALWVWDIYVIFESECVQQFAAYLIQVQTDRQKYLKS